MLALNEQVHLYSVDTNNFYYPSEDKIHNKLMRGYILRSRIRTRRNKIHRLYKKHRELQEEEVVSKLLSENENVNLNMVDFDKYITEVNIYQKDKEYIDGIYLRINKLLRKMKSNLYDEFKKNKGNTRTLKNNELTDSKVVSVFDSALTRTIGAKIGELTDEMVIVQTFFFEVLEDIILHGFMWKGKKYIVYTASAGQIRTKKTMFIKENTWKKYENTITCGLTDKVINNRGKININKNLAYKALQNSATEEWLDFDIDKVVVVSDFETNVPALVDFIDDATYEIERRKMDVPVPHTDGAGMVLPSFCSKNRMVRSPWVKGLLIPFDFREFVYRHIEKDKVNYAKIKDIYGKEYDIIKDDIQVIFTESQFKMHKFYFSWDEYKVNYKKYGCQTGYCNEEEEYLKNAKINYQMLQTLPDMTDDELKEISKETNESIEKITNNKETMMKLLGVTKENTNKNYYQQGVQYYPQLLNDSYSKNILRQIKRSMVKRAKSGKIFIDAKYTFICPDMYAFCENLFLGIKKPKGLLKDGEVSCNLYNDEQELDCLRSPHLFMEHAIRKNNVKDVHKKWFITKGLYTSSHDVISKLLQFDCDGDTSLVCSEKVIIDVAKRNINRFDIVPLYYDMKEANTTSVTNQVIYDGLTSAYRGGNIGIISNDISKVWNSGHVDKEAVEVVKLLCMENNFSIDYAKTLYKPKRPRWAKDKITKYTGNKLPYFFRYAKDKKVSNVEEINNSTVNKLDTIIKNPNLNFKATCGRFFYNKLMNNPDFEPIEADASIIGKYEETQNKSTFMVNRSSDYTTILNSSFVYENIRRDILEVFNNPIFVTDVLINYLYKERKENKKITLWESFGDIIVENIKANTTKDFKYEAIECEECGILIEKVNNRVKYCDECAKNAELEKYKRYNKKRK